MHLSMRARTMQLGMYLAFESLLIELGKIVQSSLQTVSNLVDLIYIVLQGGNKLLTSCNTEPHWLA